MSDAHSGAALSGADAGHDAPGAPGDGHGGGEGHGDHGAHASVGFYWMIGIILAVLTAVEVAAFYMELGGVEVPLLLALSAAKFAIVVMFFMHLKFDSRIFAGVFLGGLLLAVFMITALVALYHWIPA